MNAAEAPPGLVRSTVPTENKKSRFALIIRPDTWLGGRNYFRNLLMSLSKLPEPLIEPVLFVASSDDAAEKDFPPVQKVRTKLMDRGSLHWWVRQLVTRTTDDDWLLHRLLRQHQIDVISHGAPTVRRSAIPSIGWIPDFQHIHMPEFFDRDEVRARDREFKRLCDECEKVIVSSECARADLCAFAPEHAGKAEVLRFIASPATILKPPSLSELKARYHFEGHYFLIPNQFWAHKNHKAVIAALEILKAKNQFVLVLATGATKDDRHPGLFSELMQYAGDCGVLDRFRVLGTIPFNDLAVLMENAVALVNPSRFEGWSTSVEESKSMGKRILLSDIPVHREQAPPLGAYFSPDDVATLADLLWKSLAEFDLSVDSRNRRTALAAVSSRQVEFADRFQQIVLSAKLSAETIPAGSKSG